MPIEPKVVMTYIKVQAKAQSVTGAERDTADKILRRMESENPGIEQMARAFKAAQESVHTAARPHPEPEPPFETEEEEDEGIGNWENIFRWAGRAVSGVYDFAENVAQAAVGRQVAAHVKAGVRKTSSGYVTISLRIPFSAYRHALRLNAIQRAAFREAMHNFLDDQLDNILGEDD